MKTAVGVKLVCTAKFGLKKKTPKLSISWRSKWCEGIYISERTSLVPNQCYLLLYFPAPQ